MKKGKIKKILLWVGIVIVALLLVGTVLIRVLFPPEKIKTILSKQLTTFLNREVEVGKISIGLFKGITVEEFKVSRLSTFKQGTFISAKKFVVKYYLFALLKKKLIISRLTLVEPQIAIERLADGKFNFSDLMEKGSTKEEKDVQEGEQLKESQDKKSPFSFLVSKVDIVKGKVSFKDNFTNKFNADIEQLNLEVKHANLLTPFEINFSFEEKVVLDKKELNGKVDFKSKINLSNLEMDKVRIDIEQLGFISEEIDANLSGRVENINKPLFDFNFLFKVNSINKIKQFLDLPFPRNLTIKGGSILKGKVKGTLNDVLFESNLDFSGLEIVYGKLFKKSRQIPGNVKLAVNYRETKEKNKQLKINSTEVVFSNIKLKSKGMIKNFKDPHIDMDLFVEVNSIDKIKQFLFLPFPKEFAFTGTSTLSNKVKGTLKDLFVKSKLDFSGLEMSYSNFFKKTQQVPGHFKMEINYQETPLVKKQVRIDSAEFLFSDFKLNTKKATFNLDKQQLSCKLFTNQFSLQKFAVLSELITKYKVKGIAGINIYLSGDFKKPKFKGNFKLNNFCVEHKKNTITDFTTEVDFTQQSVRTKKFTAKMNGADFNISKLCVKNFKSPDVVFEGSLSEIKFYKFLFLRPPLPQGEKPAGKKEK
jgi:hypothetical protein